MEHDEITLRLEIAQRTLDLKVRKEWEYYYRNAEKIINENFLLFAKRWHYADQLDLLSKILIDFVVKWIENEERLAEYEEHLIPKMQELKELTEQITVDA